MAQGVDIMPVRFGDHSIGPAEAPFVVAEMSANHNGDLDRARAIVSAAKQAGAHAIKFQTYTADTITLKSDREEFRVSGGLWDGRKLWDLYNEAHMPWAWHDELFAHAREIGIVPFSSPFDSSAVALLEDLNCALYKIASPEIVDIDLIETVARTGKPIVMSTGAATLEEIDRAVGAVEECDARERLVLLHCMASYPAALDEANLATIPFLAERYGIPIGFSDHIPGSLSSVLAVAAGAVMIEKHFTLSSDDGGVDSAFSSDVSEFEELVTGVAQAHAARGGTRQGAWPAEQQIRLGRRSLYVVRDIAPGEIFDRDNIRSVRPARGLAPHLLPDVLGKHAACAIPANTPLSADHVEGLEI